MCSSVLYFILEQNGHLRNIALHDLHIVKQKLGKVTISCFVLYLTIINQNGHLRNIGTLLILTSSKRSLPLDTIGGGEGIL